jgi:hypothetical protein
MTKDALKPNTICIACGYDLAGLQSEGTCPECGTPCHNSLLADSMYHQTDKYLKRIILGSRLVIIAFAVIASWILVSIVGFLVGFSFAFGLISGLLNLALILLATIGWYSLTATDKLGHPMSRRTRLAKTIRILAVLLVGAKVIELYQLGQIYIILGWFTYIIIAVIPMATCILVSAELAARYAARIPGRTRSGAIQTSRVACHIANGLYVCFLLLYILDLEYFILGGLTFSGTYIDVIAIALIYLSQIISIGAAAYILINLLGNTKTVQVRNAFVQSTPPPASPPAA